MEKRRRAVLVAVIAVADHTERCMGGAQPVRAYHVRYFGLPECVEASHSTLERDLRWLSAEGYVERPRARAAEFLPTDAGRAWVVPAR